MANPELQLAADHLAVAVSQMREDLYASVYKDVPAGRFTRMIHDTSQLALAQHLLLSLRELANAPDPSLLSIAPLVDLEQMKRAEILGVTVHEEVRHAS